MYNQKISEKMLSKIHAYAEECYVPMAVYASKSASQLNAILKKAQATTEDKQLALFYITKYFQYLLKLTIKRGGIIFLQNFNSEVDLSRLRISAFQYLELTQEQICRLQKSIDLEKGIFLDFSNKIQGDHELKKIYESFEIWLNSSNVEKTIKCFRCYSNLMFHELNSIYKPWYKREAPELSRECERVLRTLKEKEEEKLNN